MASDNFYDNVLRLTVPRMDSCSDILLMQLDCQQLTVSLSVHIMHCSSVVMLHRTARNDILFGLEPVLTPQFSCLTLLSQVV
jgi:hypothetical protein